MQTNRILFAVAALIAAAISSGCKSPSTGRARDAHLLWKGDPATRRIESVRKAGPFWEEVVTADGARRESWRPLLHTTIEAPAQQASLSEWLWPVYSRSKRLDQTTWRFLCFSGMTKDETRETTPQDRTWLFPFWFSGTSKTGDDYAALFPIGGTIREMYYDKISFAVFPAWVAWERNGNRSWSVLWPIIQRQKGPHRDALRIFPLWGRSRFDDHYDASFILWPFWTQARHVTHNPGSEWMLWPLVGHVARTNETAWYFLPPFFSHAKGRGKQPQYRKTWAPWPLVLVADDSTHHRRRFLPFWSRRWRSDGKAEARTVMWPFWHDLSIDMQDAKLREWTFFPVFHSSVVETADKNNPGHFVLQERYTRVWPIWSRRYDRERRYTRIPDFSFQKREGPLERNLLGMLTLYSRGENTGAGGEKRRVDHEALWGMWKSGHGDGGEWNWSLLGGFIGASGRDGEPSKWRFLWFFGGDD